MRSLLPACLPLLLLRAGLGVRLTGLPSSSALRRAEAALASATAGGVELLRVAHCVPELDGAARFYEACFGFAAADADAAPDGRPRKLLTCSTQEHALRLELVETAGKGHDDAGGYRGVSIRVPDLDAAIATVADNGGSLLEEAVEMEYVAARVPDEPDESSTTVRQALVADPSGYPVLLYQGPSELPALLTAVRLDVHVWKASEEWYGRTLGWSTLRWQSHVPNEPVICVTVGSSQLAGQVGPCGPMGEEARPALQLRYAYSSEPVKHAGGLEAVVLSTGPGGIDVQDEPDAYPLVFAD